MSVRKVIIMSLYLQKLCHSEDLTVFINQLDLNSIHFANGFGWFKFSYKGNAITCNSGNSTRMILYTYNIITTTRRRDKPDATFSRAHHHQPHHIIITSHSRLRLNMLIPPVCLCHYSALKTDYHGSTTVVYLDNRN